MSDHHQQQPHQPTVAWEQDWAAVCTEGYWAPKHTCTIGVISESGTALFLSFFLISESELEWCNKEIYQFVNQILKILITTRITPIVRWVLNFPVKPSVKTTNKSEKKSSI